MKTGLLGGASLVASEWKKLYTVTAPGDSAALIASFCNKGIDMALAQLAIVPGAAVTDAGTLFLEFNGEVAPGIPLERTGIVIQTGLSIWAMADVNGVDVALYGFERDKV